MKRSLLVLTILSFVAMAVAVLPATATGQRQGCDRCGRIAAGARSGRMVARLVGRLQRRARDRSRSVGLEVQHRPGDLRDRRDRDDDELDRATCTSTVTAQLDITALGHGQSWTSGRIQTISSDFGAPAGGEMAVTASIRQPNPSSGLGYWPAFWMLGPGDWPGDRRDRHPRGRQRPQRACRRRFTAATSTTPTRTARSARATSSPGCRAGCGPARAARRASTPTPRWSTEGTRPTSRSAGTWTAGSSSRSMRTQVGEAAWSAAVDHGYSIIFDLAIGGGYPDGVCGCTTPTDQTTSGGTMTVRYVAVYNRGH